MANGVKFFPGSTVVYTPGTATTEMHIVNTGALVGGVTKTVTHGFGLDDIWLGVRDANNLAMVNILKVTAGDETNKFDIQSGVDLAGGLDVIVLGNMP